MSFSGSIKRSPNTWGRRHPCRKRGERFRNTPTCVGKTTETGLAGAWNGKHPHMRGEDIVTLSITQPPEETPPHAWGRLCRGQGAVPHKGNTPTCVGKTTGISARTTLPGKHPHMRGEDHRNWTGGSLEWETPPHAWGRHRHALHHSASGGNTPTCVGKTVKAHPSKDDWTETPPHAWGRPFLWMSANCLMRNTPTCVGKTGSCSRTRRN